MGVLFHVTALTTFLAGCLYAAGYQSSLGLRPRLLSAETFGLAYAYAVPVLAIVWAHEGGHWLIAQKWETRISGPFFLPLPWPWVGVSAGLLGAFMVLREPLPCRRAAFDYAVAGPVAGFLVTLPILAIGIGLSHPATTPTARAFHDPLLLQWLSGDMVYHPVLTAAWWGLVMTAVNLIPCWPLDGWRLARAVFADGVPLGRLRLGLLGGAIGLLVLCWPPLPLR